MFSPHLVLSITYLRQDVLVMLKSMGLNALLPHQSPILPLRYAVTFGYVSYASKLILLAACRFDLRSLPRLYFPGQTPLPIQNAFTPVCWNILMTLMSRPKSMIF